MKYVPVHKTQFKWLWLTPLIRVLRRWKIFAALGVLIATFLVLPWTGRDPLLRFQYGMTAATDGDAQKVLHEASLLLQTPGFESYGHMLRGTWFLKSQELAAAASEFGLATDDPNTRLAAYTRRGEAFYRMHQFVKAEQMLLQALELDADNSDARRWLASTYYDLQKPFLIIVRRCTAIFQPQKEMLSQKNSPNVSFINCNIQRRWILYKMPNLLHRFLHCSPRATPRSGIQ